MLSGCWVADEGSVRYPVGGCNLLFLNFTLSPLFFSFFFNILNYFLAMVGLNCSMWDLSLWGMGFSLDVAPVLSSCDFPTMACGILVPPPGIKPSSLALEGRFLTTEPPGKAPSHFSLSFSFVFSLIVSAVWKMAASRVVWIVTHIFSFPAWPP